MKGRYRMKFRSIVLAGVATTGLMTAGRMATSAHAQMPAARPVVTQPADASRVAQGLVAHRAVYKLTLDHPTGNTESASGTMAYEVSDSCDGWTVRQRLQLNIVNRDGQPVQMVSDYATYESKDGTRLGFRMQQNTDDAITEQVEGNANLDHLGGAGQVHYTVPRDETKKLPQGTLFPMWHTATIIAAAEAGTKFVQLPLFDGTSADGAQESSVVVVSWDKTPQTARPELKNLPSGRVHVAFFKPGKSVIQPDYEVGMRYWENGVADALRMDFGDFIMNGKLDEFTLRPGKCG